MTHLVLQLSKKLANAGTLSPTDLFTNEDYVNTIKRDQNFPGPSTQGLATATAGLNLLAGNDISDSGLSPGMRSAMTHGQNAFTNWIQSSPGTADWLVSERDNPNIQRMIYDRFVAENPNWQQNLIPEVDPSLMTQEMLDQFTNQYQTAGGGAQGLWEGVQGAYNSGQGLINSIPFASTMLTDPEGYKKQYLEGMVRAVADNPDLLRKINQGTVVKQYTKNRVGELGDFWSNLGGDIGTGAGNILTYLLGLLGKAFPDFKNLLTGIQERHSDQGSQSTLSDEDTSEDDDGELGGTGGAN